MTSLPTSGHLIKRQSDKCHFSTDPNCTALLCIQYGGDDPRWEPLLWSLKLSQTGHYWPGSLLGPDPGSQ